MPRKLMSRKKSIGKPTASQSPVGNKGGYLNVLLHAIASGDVQALETLYEVTLNQVYGLVNRILTSHRDTEEVVCDVYCQIWESAERYNDCRGHAMAWILTIARSRAIDRWRQLSAERHQLMNLSLRGELLDEMTDDPLNAFDQSSMVWHILDNLPFTVRQVITLAYFKGLSHHEIALTLDLAEGTVKSHLRCALQKLRIHWYLYDSLSPKEHN